MVLLSPCSLPGQRPPPGVERVCFQQPVYPRNELTGILLVLLKQERQVVKAGEAFNSCSAANCICHWWPKRKSLRYCRSSGVTASVQATVGSLNRRAHTQESTACTAELGWPPLFRCKWAPPRMELAALDVGNGSQLWPDDSTRHSAIYGPSDSERQSVFIYLPSKLWH